MAGLQLIWAMVCIFMVISRTFEPDSQQRQPRSQHDRPNNYDIVLWGTWACKTIAQNPEIQNNAGFDKVPRVTLWFVPHGTLVSEPGEVKLLHFTHFPLLGLFFVLIAAQMKGTVEYHPAQFP